MKKRLLLDFAGTVNQEIFIVEIFRTRMRIININVHGKGLFLRKLFNTKICTLQYV